MLFEAASSVAYLLSKSSKFWYRQKTGAKTGDWVPVGKLADTREAVSFKPQISPISAQ